MLAGTVIDYLNENSGAFTALLTLVLIGVTSCYVVLNWRMVGEMKKAREQTLLPKLTLDLHPGAPTILFPAIKNVGPGAAFDVAVALMFLPIDENKSVIERVWRANVIAPGESHEFISEIDTAEERRAGDRPPEEYWAMRLTGSMKDALGQVHEVNEAFDELPSWWDLKKIERYRDEPERRLARELHEKVGKPLISAIESLRKPR